jgi:hypothetical protein
MATQARHMVGGDLEGTVALCGKVLGVICYRRMITDLDWRRRKGRWQASGGGRWALHRIAHWSCIRLHPHPNITSSINITLHLYLHDIWVDSKEGHELEPPVVLVLGQQV